MKTLGFLAQNGPSYAEFNRATLLHVSYSFRFLLVSQIISIFLTRENFLTFGELSL